MEATSEERREEETHVCSVHRRPLIKSLLNHVTILPLAKRVAVISNSLSAVNLKVLLQSCRH